MTKEQKGAARNATGTTLGVSSVGVVAVWVLNTFVLQTPIAGEIAVAIGSLATGATRFMVDLIKARAKR